MRFWLNQRTRAILVVRCTLQPVSQWMSRIRFFRQNICVRWREVSECAQIIAIRIKMECTTNDAFSLTQNYVLLFRIGQLQLIIIAPKVCRPFRFVDYRKYILLEFLVFLCDFPCDVNLNFSLLFHFIYWHARSETENNSWNLQLKLIKFHILVDGIVCNGCSMLEHRLENNLFDLQNKQLAVSHSIYIVHSIHASRETFHSSECICRRCGILPEQIPMYSAHTKWLPLHHPDLALATVHTQLNRTHLENPYQPYRGLRSVHIEWGKRNRRKCFMYLNIGLVQSCSIVEYFSLVVPNEWRKKCCRLQSLRLCAVHTVNLILARWNDNSCRIVCDRAVSAYFDAGYTLNNGTGTSGMRCPNVLCERK